MCKFAAVVVVVILTAASCFQLALAMGLPASQLSRGGQFTGALPEAYRWASLVAIAPLAIASWVVMSRADIMRPGSKSIAIEIAAWIFTGYLSLNTLGNLISKSSLERLIMTPVSLVLVVCVTLVACSRQQQAGPPNRR